MAKTRRISTMATVHAVTTCLESLEMSGNLAAVRELTKSGKCHGKTSVRELIIANLMFWTTTGLVLLVLRILLNLLSHYEHFCRICTDIYSVLVALTLIYA